MLYRNICEKYQLKDIQNFETIYGGNDCILKTGNFFSKCSQTLLCIVHGYTICYSAIRQGI